MEAFRHILPLVAQVSLIAIVLSVGLQTRWSDFLYAVRRPALLLRGVVAVNLVAPLVAAVLVTLFPIGPAVKAGIVLMAVAPLAPLVPGKMLKAGAQPSFAVGLYLSLMLLAIVIVPLTIALLGRAFGLAIAVEAGPIAQLVLISVLAPLVAGAALAAVTPAFAARLSPAILMIGNLGFLVIVVAVLAGSGKAILGVIGSGALVVIVLTTLASLAAGHLLGGPEPVDRVALAFAASTRHPGIAVLIARANFDDPQIVPAILLYLLTGVIVSALYGAWAMKRVALAAAPAQ